MAYFLMGSTRAINPTQLVHQLSGYQQQVSQFQGFQGHSNLGGFLQNRRYSRTTNSPARPN